MTHLSRPASRLSQLRAGTGLALVLWLAPAGSTGPKVQERPGALLPGHRIVAFYGNPRSAKLGILGALPPAIMLEELARTAERWAATDPTTPVRPALHLIATCAERAPGVERLYRGQYSSQTIEGVAGWAEARGWLLVLDLQVGHSSLAKEIARLLPWLSRPYVHLALDPEFAMKDDTPPGRRIGTMDATEVNGAIALLARLVDSLGLPPKVLVVHRFTTAMLTNAGSIRVDPRVQVVIDMDGFGTKSQKRATYRSIVAREAVQFTGFKLFTQPWLDRPLMTPKEVLALRPRPVYILYQ